MRRKTSWTLTLAVLLVALLLNGVRPSEATAAEVKKLQHLYAEFLTFKNDPDFHAVGYGPCCRYYAWMKKVEALRGGHTGGFLTQFGIGPGISSCSAGSTTKAAATATRRGISSPS